MENNKQVQQDNGNLSIYERVRCVPKEAKKEIEAGRLKGKHDINPMWRIKALTEVFGPAGFGWYTEIVRTWTEASESGGEGGKTFLSSWRLPEHQGYAGGDA